MRVDEPEKPEDADKQQHDSSILTKSGIAGS
jgi:hypothetical protein